MSILFWVGLLVLICVICFYSFSVEIPPVHLGLPEHFFYGRFKRKKTKEGYTEPIRKPYNEGRRLKSPLIQVKKITREVKTRKFDRSPFPVRGGGTILISGIIQYRASFNCLFRHAEVGEEGVKDGLTSELNHMVGLILSRKPDKKGNEEDAMENALLREVDIDGKLRKKLTNTLLNPDRDDPDKQETGQEPRTRRVFGELVTYAENSYGIEILKVSIDKIEPTEEMEKARSQQQKEVYERKGEIVEWNNLLERMAELKKKFPGLDEKAVLRAIQAWKGHTDLKSYDINIPTEVINALLPLFGGKK